MNHSLQPWATTAIDGLDALDRKIVAELIRDGRLPNAELARRVGLSPSPCWKRVRALEERGIIAGYTIRLGFETLGLRLCMLVQVTLEKHASDAMDGFAAAVAAMPEVVEASMVAGDFDFLLKVRTADTHSYERFLRERLHRVPGVRQVRSILVLGG
ncbi:Lrp/AsnC family transcriptional regulator [Sphingopyxis sp. J-6]|uniref:Lrp/AsnC family transcriptional regulator n=1 Tax=Sphingopyxis sp. J-6 TaxID=3122054 RepID=UPI0039843840